MAVWTNNLGYLAETHKQVREQVHAGAKEALNGLRYAAFDVIDYEHRDT